MGIKIDEIGDTEKVKVTAVVEEVVDIMDLSSGAYALTAPVEKILVFSNSGNQVEYNGHEWNILTKGIEICPGKELAFSYAREGAPQHFNGIVKSVA